MTLIHQCVVWFILAISLFQLGCKNRDNANSRPNPANTSTETNTKAERFANAKNTVVIASGVNRSDLVASEILWNEGKIFGSIWSKGLGWRLFVTVADVDKSIRILEKAKKTGRLSAQCLLMSTEEKVRLVGENSKR